MRRASDRHLRLEHERTDGGALDVVGRVIGFFHPRRPRAVDFSLLARWIRERVLARQRGCRRGCQDASASQCWITRLACSLRSAATCSFFEQHLCRRADARAASGVSPSCRRSRHLDPGTALALEPPTLHPGQGARLSTWPREESNLRSQVRSLPLYPLSYGPVPPDRSDGREEVADGTRTRDHRDHNPGLYQLSYRHRAETQDSRRLGSRRGGPAAHAVRLVARGGRAGRGDARRSRATRRADVVIVGRRVPRALDGLAAEGARACVDVVVLEAGLAGHGPSGRNGGFVSTLWDDLPILRDRVGDERALAVAARPSAVSAGSASGASGTAVDGWYRAAPTLVRRDERGAARRLGRRDRGLRGARRARRGARDRRGRAPRALRRGLPRRRDPADVRDGPPRPARARAAREGRRGRRPPARAHARPSTPRDSVAVTPRGRVRAGGRRARRQQRDGRLPRLPPRAMRSRRATSS